MLTKTITIRLSNEEREFLNKEKERLYEGLGFRASVGDIVRMAISLYEWNIEHKKVNVRIETSKKINFKIEDGET